MTDWMTRQEAAQYLRVSLRQLDRLRLPRTMLGDSPRYSRTVVDDHLERATIEPPQAAKKGGPRPPFLGQRLPPPTDVKAELLKLRRRGH